MDPPSQYFRRSRNQNRLVLWVSIAEYIASTIQIKAKVIVPPTPSPTTTNQSEVSTMTVGNRLLTEWQQASEPRDRLPLTTQKPQVRIIDHLWAP